MLFQSFIAVLPIAPSFFRQVISFPRLPDSKVHFKLYETYTAVKDHYSWLKRVMYKGVDLTGLLGGGA